MTNQSKGHKMKFQTADLIARIDESIAAITAKVEQENEAAAEKAEGKRVEWIAFYMPLYAELATTIRALNRKGLPFTQADFPEELTNQWGDRLQVWTPSVLKVAPQAWVDNLLALRAALSASADMTVTTTGLRELGFRNIAHLFGGTR